MGGELARFAELCGQLAATSRRLEKRSLISEYLRSLDSRDAARAVLYLSGSPFSGTDSRGLNAGGALLVRMLAEASGADAHTMHLAYLRHGDLGSAAFDLLDARLVPPLLTLPTLKLQDAEETFAEVAAVRKPEMKERLIAGLIGRATPLEAKYLVKIILGDMRTGVKESLVEEAIAAAYEVHVAQVRRAMMLNGSLPEVLAMAAENRLEQARMKLFHPLGFMLASPVATVEEAMERFSKEAREGLGEAREELTEGEAAAPDVQAANVQLPKARLPDAQLEDKYDGIRAQIHCGSFEQPGRVAIFSRTRDDMTASFPEIVEAFAEFPEPLILDGEILAWGRGDGVPSTGSNGRALPFTSLQSRLGRKRVTEEMRASTPVVFVAFDLLYAGGELLLERPLAERRQVLESLVARERSRTVTGSRLPAKGQQARFLFEEAPANDAFSRLVLAPAVALGNAQQLEQAYWDARARGNEGVMLKARQSMYQPGRRGLAWLKLKRELATLDVVVTAAEYGHGKRAGSLSDYTFAVRDGETLKNVGKAYSGVTDAEIAQLTGFFLEHTVEEQGSTRIVEPLVVLEVAFNNVMRSGRHDSGYALRFPRIVRIRHDKPVSEIDTLDRVAGIYQSQI